MPLAVIDYPEIDPVLVEIFGLPLRWYSLAYLGGLFLGWYWMRLVAQRRGVPVSVRQIDDFLAWATIGVILGGRLGYVLFYKPGFYLDHPLQALQIWDGGMSFHGGLLGVIAAIVLFSRKQGINPFRFSDLVACATPIGLFFGRIANFINGELWGRPTDAAWAMVFPRDPLQVPRHPSQLYEAALEGVVLFALINWMAFRSCSLVRPGLLTGVFCAGYGLSRYFVEFAREPDTHLGLFAGFISMGQVLSLPMVAFGGWLIWRALRSDVPGRAGRPAEGTGR